MASSADSLAGILQIPGVQELLNSQITQTRQQEPLRVGATQTALGMLPNSSFHGSSARPDVSAIAPANYKTAAPQAGGSSGLAQALKYLAAAGAGAEGARGGVDLVKAAKWLKDLFSKGNGTLSQPGQPLLGGGQPFQYPFSGFAGNEGMDYGNWPGGYEPTPGVSTSEEFQFPLDYPFPDSPTGGGVLPGLPGSGGMFPPLADPYEE